MRPLPSSPQPRPTVQRARCIPRSSTGLVPTSFKRAMEEAASPKKWTKLPPKPIPEMHPYRGDRVAALRHARNPYKAPVTGNAKSKAKAQRSNIEESKKSASAKKKEERWDAHLLGDKCMYKFSNQECAKKVEIREQYTIFLQQLAKERGARIQHNSSQESNFAVNSGRAQALTPPAQNCDILKRQLRHNPKNDRNVGRKWGVGCSKGTGLVSKIKQTLPKTKTSSISSPVCCDDDQTIRSLVTAAIDDNESVKKARAVLENVRRRLKLDEPTITATVSSPLGIIADTRRQVADDATNLCREDQSIFSAVTKAIHEDHSVIAARVALEEARARLENLGFLSGRGETFSVYNTQSELLGDDSTVAVSASVYPSTTMINATIPPMEYISVKDSKKDFVLPSLVALDSFSFSAAGNDGRISNNGEKSYTCFESHLNLEVSTGIVDEISSPRDKPQYTESDSRPLKSSKEGKSDDTPANLTARCESLDTDSHVMELRSAASPPASLNKSDWEDKSIWNPLVLMDGGDSLFKDDNENYDETENASPSPCTTAQDSSYSVLQTESFSAGGEKYI